MDFPAPCSLFHSPDFNSQHVRKAAAEALEKCRPEKAGDKGEGIKIADMTVVEWLAPEYRAAGFLNNEDEGIEPQDGPHRGGDSSAGAGRMDGRSVSGRLSLVIGQSGVGESEGSKEVGEVIEEQGERKLGA